MRFLLYKLQEVRLYLTWYFCVLLNVDSIHGHFVLFNGSSIRGHCDTYLFTMTFFTLIRNTLLRTFVILVTWFTSFPTLV